MSSKPIRSAKLTVTVQQWPLVTPFRITGYTWEALDALVVTLEKDGKVGRGEAAGVYYKADTPAEMLKRLESLRASIESSVSRETLQQLLPPGGARNAIDCALWDLEAKLTGEPVWRSAGLREPQPLVTTFTAGAETPDKMAATARGYKGAQAIKLKLTGQPMDADRVRSVRAALPDVWIGVDANQGFTRKSLEQLMPVLVGARVALIEQPFPVGQEAQVDGLNSPIPLAADETAQSLADVAGLAGRFQVVNIKLDKCGGLTEGLAMARRARDLGLDTMVGNMLGTSLAMAPGFYLGQLCSVVDLDGPIFLKSDRSPTVRYENGLISCPEALWGY